MLSGTADALSHHDFVELLSLYWPPNGVVVNWRVVFSAIQYPHVRAAFDTTNGTIYTDDSISPIN